MQNAEFYKNMPETLAAKVQAYAEQTAAKAQNICRRYGVEQTACEAFILDAVDMLRAQYNGLRATTEQMRALAAVPQRSWDRTENAALCFMAQYYAKITEYVDGARVLSFSFVDAVIVREEILRTPDIPLSGGSADYENLYSEAQRLYYTYAVLIAAEWCNATEDELRGIEPYGGITISEDAKTRAIAAGLHGQRQRQSLTALKRTKQQRRAAVKDTPVTDAADIFCVGTLKQHSKLPDFLPADKTITHFQNIAYEIGNGIQTADLMGVDGRGGAMLPLWRSIEQQRQAAMNLMNDAQATDIEKRQAAQLLTNTRCVNAVVDTLQILPQVLPPDSGSTTRRVWEMTPYRYACIILGTDKPKPEDTMALLRATAWLSTQRVAVKEITTKRGALRGDDGKIIYGDNGKPKLGYIKREKSSYIQPIVVQFNTEKENGVLIEDATRIVVEVHRLFAEGRSAEYIEDDGKRQYIDAARRQVLTIEQYYDFSTEAERIFRNIILSRPKQAEDALLAKVFNYEKRQATQDAKAAEARRTAEQTQAAAEAIKNNTTATPEQIADAQQQAAAAADAAERAAEQAKYYLRNHIGDDVTRLKAMFEKALQNGLITGYYDRGRSGSNGKTNYGRGVVWHWLRPTKEDVKRRRIGKQAAGM